MDRTTSPTLPLPVCWEECRSRGWDHLDILLVTGDAYIDHPSFGVALIGRLLESHGFQVAILSQPRFDSAKDFRQFPIPRLFCGITAGNLDSIVANYSSNGKVRDSDAYSPAGNPWRGNERIKTERRRPDRASLVYTSLARSVYRNIPIVLGGIEASLRRFVHYDYKQQKLRCSLLTDAKADLLIYGMGEKAVVEVAKRCEQQKDLAGIAGTCQRLTDRELTVLSPDVAQKSSRRHLILPSWHEITAKTALFLDAEIAIDRHCRAYSTRTVLQRQQTHWLVQHPAPQPLTSDELDALYRLPYARRAHPEDLPVPALKMIKDSVTIVRGCAGNCSFCAIAKHQGPAIVSRSNKSIYEECQHISQGDDFGGTISDLGGPTANLFGTRCARGSCRKRDCLFPQICPHLEIDEDLFLDLLNDISSIPAVRNVFISSGLRMELLLNTPRLMKRIIEDHTPGALKIAPEHTDDELLRLMHKEPHSLLKKFVGKCKKIGMQSGRKTVQLTPYVITAHPGSTTAHSERLVKDLQSLKLHIRQFQDFTPTPGTLSTAMYVTGLRPDTRRPLSVPRKQSEKMEQRRVVEGYLKRPKSKPPQTGRKKKR